MTSEFFDTIKPIIKKITLYQYALFFFCILFFAFDRFSRFFGGGVRSEGQRTGSVFRFVKIVRRTFRHDLLPVKDEADQHDQEHDEHLIGKRDGIFHEKNYSFPSGSSMP